MTKPSWHFCVALLLIISIASTVSAYYLNMEEYAYEMSDLQIMGNVASAVQIEWKNSIPDELVEYWFDATTCSLVPISDSKPFPYGLGTQRYGGAVRDFQEQTGIKFKNYSDAESYKEKLLHVAVYEQDDGISIALDWVDAG